jgi:hypothetical protein
LEHESSGGSAVICADQIPQVLAWSKDELANFGPGLVALAVLAIFSSRIRRAVNKARMGQPVPQHSLSPATVWTLVVLPVAWWLWNLWISWTQEAFFMHITEEDGWMEYGQVLLLILGSMTSGLLARSLWKQRLRFWALGYLLLVLALFWTAGEEISWGQRLLHLSTPAWLALHNTQQEMSLHNLTGVDEELSALTDQALSWAVLLSAAAWMTGLHRLKRLHAALWLPHPSRIAAFCWMFINGRKHNLYALLHPEAQRASATVGQLQEPREIILYFSVLAFLLIVRSALKSEQIRRDRDSSIEKSGSKL